ncbi:ATP-binding protein [Shewanella eurypsychrophilus]|uniref:ATP-binding protein n=1 Tax=Shewanella eurypsychrophilus TaxID=2593656 RepID=A0ABX6VBA6_9GAMM|nr:MULTISPECIES: ATP-binding protein [Shewanella]QFU24775.1 AAA family ATPase [Shewanella sp. YLB-09]QPG59965.1 ATP-binding protein [Shewanella eurypsychrophilus]
MTYYDSILLPSQETLVQRLQHVSLYSQQLIAVTGGNGSGKTTLITSLLTELEEYSSALVTCPKHCSSSEIRRKILVQLFSEPVFDDEVALPETVLRLSKAMPQSSFIVLDDAHYLPMELIAECIILSQLTIPGKTISLTLTCSQAFFNELEMGLSEDLQESLLSISIDPLSNKEKEALYYTLLSRSDEDPFTPREIVKTQLEKQLGTPQEVVNLLELSLNGQVEIVTERKWTRAIVTGVLALFIVLLSWSLFKPVQSVPHPTVDETVTQPEPRVSLLSLYGERVLLGYFMQRQPVTQNHQAVEVTKKVKGRADSNADIAIEEDPKAIVEKPLSQIGADVEDVIGSEDVVKTFEGLEAFDSAEAQSIEVAEVSTPALTGFTLQLASVRKRNSLLNILNEIENEPDVHIARHNKRWVVLLGTFSSLSSARQKASLLTHKYHLKSPWTRQWKDLAEYELQEGFTIDDIRQ